MNEQPEKISRLFGATNSLSDLFKKARAASKNLPVATLGKIKSIDETYSDDVGFGVATVAPIPALTRGADYTIEAWCFSDEFTAGDIVIVVFTDRDFRTAMRSAASAEYMQQGDDIRHSECFGVMIKLKATNQS